MPPVSSIIVTRSTGERAVISLNATKLPATPAQLPDNLLAGIEVVLIDGHQMTISQVIAPAAKQQKIPVVIDGGRWKAGFEAILPEVDYAICSANFYPPNCHNFQDVFNYLQALNIPHVAITQGEKPIQYFSEEKFEEVKVSNISAADTLGAGDIFHGAFCHYILNYQFRDALTAAAKVASYSCQYFGTRQWMYSGFQL